MHTFETTAAFGAGACRLPRTAPLTLAALLLAMFAALAPETASAQWIRDPGHAYVKLGYRVIRADSIYAPDGSTQRVGDGYRQHALGVYGEVGIIRHRLALSLDGDLFRRSVLVNQGQTSGLGDLRLGALIGLLRAPFHLGLALHLGIPTGDAQPQAGPGASSSDQLVARSLPTGDGEWDVALRVNAGHGFSGGEGYPFDHYVVGEVGVWVRGLRYRELPAGLLEGGRALQIVYRAEFGTSPKREGWNRLQLILRLTGVDRLAPRGEGARSTVGLGAGVRFVSPGVELSLRLFDQFRLGLSAEGALAAANVPAAANWTLFASWQR